MMKIRVQSAEQYRVDAEAPDVHPDAESVVDREAPPPARGDGMPPAPAPVEARSADRHVPASMAVAGTPTPRSTSASPARGRPVAVFVAHGMGQQLRFSTLDTAARGVESALDREGVDGRRVTDVAVDAKTVTLGEVRTQRLEMTVTLDGEGPSPPPVHFYEGYWAPLTEGQVTLRDVMRFLVRGAWNGLRKGVGQPLERYLFDHNALHRVPLTAFLGLLATTLALGSLVLLNAVIAGVVVDASYDVLTETPGVVGSAPTARAAGGPGELAAPVPVLPRALTAIVVSYLAVTLLFGLFLVLASAATKPPYERGGPNALLAGFLVVVQALFYVWVLATLAAGIATLATLLFSTGLPLPSASFLGVVGIVAAASAASAAAASWAHGRRLMAGYDAHVAAHADADPLPDYGRRPLAGWRLQLVTGALVLSVVVALACAVALLAPWFPAWIADAVPLTDVEPFRVAAWFVLFGVSAYLRNVIVQFFGDVAAYVSPHTLDRFAALRTAIREASETVLRGIYHAVGRDGARLYDGVAVVGHSLGSVVAYDALNRVLSHDDAVEAAEPADGADVRGRTRLLLTFGSPLDKTAYIFRSQNQSLSRVREALANAVQPLIQDARHRTFPWVNVHSPRDIIGSALHLYDVPSVKQRQVERTRPPVSGPDGAAGVDGSAPETGGFGRELARAHRGVGEAGCPYCVHDVDDPDARTPLLAHNEHWEGRAVFDVLVAAVFSTQAASPAAVHHAAHAAEAG